MGMFDTFYGNYKCPSCGSLVKFEEQTKDYDCCLQEFFLGDYVDRGNRNYYYTFSSNCPGCRKQHEISLAIRNGQFAKVLFRHEADETDIMSIENIEDGYECRLIYERKCMEKIGSEEPVPADFKLEQMHVGGTVEVLRTKWMIEEVYQEKPIENEEKPKSIFFCDKNYIYRVSDGIDKRILVTRINPFMGDLHISIVEDTFEQKEKWENEDYGRRFILQSGSKLARLE